MTKDLDVAEADKDRVAFDLSMAAELERVYPSLQNRARILTQDREKADDLVQQVCEKALRVGRNLRPGSDLLAWMKQVMRNLFIDEYRSRRRCIPLEDEPEAATDSYVMSPIDVVKFEDVRRCLDNMSAPDREVLHLALFDRLPYKELSVRLGIPLKTVGTRIFRAKARLRSRLVHLVEGAHLENVVELYPCK